MYSTGMQLRLGFAIASHLEPDVFVVDEALAVGDAGFQSKCVERMTRLVAEGKTLLFVSHNLSAVEALCNRGIFLTDGRIERGGTAREALRSYLDWMDAIHQSRLGQEFAVRSSKALRLERVSLHDAQGAERYAFRTYDDVEIRLGFSTTEILFRPHVSIGISDGRPGNLVLCSMLVDGGAPEAVSGRFEVRVRLSRLPLLPRVYQLWCSVRSARAFGDILDWQPVGAFRVAAPEHLVGPAALAHTATDGPVHVDHTWEIQPCP